MNPVDRAMRGADGSPLSKRQKADICRAAGQAWRAQGRPLLEEAQALPEELRPSAAAVFETWRREQQALACGKRHLTSASQRDYAACLAHFLGLCGRPRAAEYYLRQDAANPLRMARAKYAQELRAASDCIADPARYAASIARAKFKARPEDLGARQLWVLIFDLRRSASARRKKGVRA